jgi:aldose 1-epimerase
MLSPKSLQAGLFSLTFLLSPVIFRAAGSPDNELDLKENSAVGLSVTRESFGTTPDGTPVDKYTLTNVHGVSVAILTYGGIVQSIEVPDKNGKPRDIALGFDRLDDYIKGGVSRGIWM